MTDEQIIKALDMCSNWENDKTCEECPANVFDFSCANKTSKFALSLINRQKAEIERMENQNTLLLKKKCKDINTARKIIKSEAIKDFAKRLKSKLNDLEFRTKTHRKTVPAKFCDDNANWVMHECVPEEIDKLVKEMTEVQK